jgi:hypothetical protein
MRSLVAEYVAIGVGALAVLRDPAQQIVGDSYKKFAGVTGEDVHVERAAHARV